MPPKPQRRSPKWNAAREDRRKSHARHSCRRRSLRHGRRNLRRAAPRVWRISGIRRHLKSRKQQVKLAVARCKQFVAPPIWRLPEHENLASSDHLAARKSCAMPDFASRLRARRGRIPHAAESRKRTTSRLARGGKVRAQAAQLIASAQEPARPGHRHRRRHCRCCRRTEILGKPASVKPAPRNARAPEWQGHQVHTGVAIAAFPARPRAVFDEVTQVEFAEMLSAEISEYAASGEPADKAGGYGIQGRADDSSKDRWLLLQRDGPAAGAAVAELRDFGSRFPRRLNLTQAFGTRTRQTPTRSATLPADRFAGRGSDRASS